MASRRVRERTILLVDDDPFVLDSLGRLLEDDGYRVVGVGDPEAAFAYLERGRVDLVVLDIRLERNRSGLEVLEFARLRADLEEMPVVILTGVSALSSIEEDIVRRFSADVFFKPYGYPAFLKKIQTLMKSRVPR